MHQLPHLKPWTQCIILPSDLLRVTVIVRATAYSIIRLGGLLLQLEEISIGFYLYIKLSLAVYPVIPTYLNSLFRVENYLLSHTISGLFNAQAGFILLMFRHNGLHIPRPFRICYTCHLKRKGVLKQESNARTGRFEQIENKMSNWSNRTMVLNLWYVYHWW